MARKCRQGLLCSLLLLSGCAEVRSAARVRQLESQLRDLKERQQQSQERQEELENRVLVLQDQLDSARIDRARRGAVDLPVVTLQPGAPPPPPAAPLPGEAPAPVEFAGAARSDEPERIRPLLRAEGDSFAAAVQPIAPQAPNEQRFAEGRRAPAPGARRARSTPAAPAAPAALPAVAPAGDNLGVVPVPRLPLGSASLGKASPIVPALAPSLSAAAPRLASAAPRRASESGEPMALYRTAYDHLRGSRYGEAERDLREFVRRFPRHDYADNAQYWLGETFYARRSYGEAASAFRAVVERWPAGNKAPDALLKLGFTLLLMGDGQKGRAVLTQVTEHYPGTDAARLAEGRLSALKEGK